MLPRDTDSSTASRPVLGNPAKGKDMGTNNCPNNDCPAYVWLVYIGKTTGGFANSTKLQRLQKNQEEINFCYMLSSE